MKFLALILILAITAVVLTQAERDHPEQYNLSDAANLFDKFVEIYHKVYKDGTDREKHYEAFKKNIASINKKNIVNFPNAYYGIDSFADYTKNEINDLAFKNGWR